MGTLKCYRTNKKNSGKLIRWKICFSDGGIKRNFTHFSFSFYFIQKLVEFTFVLPWRKILCLHQSWLKGEMFVSLSSRKEIDFQEEFPTEIHRLIIFCALLSKWVRRICRFQFKEKVTIQRNSCFNLFSLAKCNNIGKSGKSLSDSQLLIRPRYKDISTQSNISCDSKLLKVCTYLNP